MSTISYGVDVSVDPGLACPAAPRRVEAVVCHVLAAEEVAAAQISVTFLPDARIAALNERHLGHAGPTDVISFALHPPGAPPVGDIYVGVEQALRQAAECGVSPAEECLRLTVHGVLHVLGYDHPDSEDRADSPMYRRQEALLAAAAPHE